MPVATPTKPAARKSPRGARAAAPASPAPATVTKSRPAPRAAARPAASLTLSSKNYSSWSLRGWLLTRFDALPFEEVMLPTDDESARKELLLLAPSILVPCLRHEGVTVWNTLAIAEYLAETFPKAGLWPADRVARAHARAICGEMNSGFANLRASLPMNLKAHFPRHKIWAGAKPDIERIVEIWSECLARYGGPFLFGKKRCAADAMFAPVVTRFLTYDVPVNPACLAYCDTIMTMPELQEWIAAARLEPDEIEQLDMDF